MALSSSVMRELGDEIANAIAENLDEIGGECTHARVRYAVYPTVDRLMTACQSEPLIVVRPLTAELEADNSDRCEVSFRAGFQVDLLYKLPPYQPLPEDVGLQGVLLTEYGDFEAIDGQMRLLELLASYLTSICDDVEISLLFDEPILVKHGIYHGAIAVKQQVAITRGAGDA